MKVTFTDHLPDILKSVQKDAEALVDRTALSIEVRIKTSMTEPKTGRIYGKHQASAPGEAPAIDTKKLIKSISTEKDGPLKRVVGTDVEYATPLEFGSDRIEPRPAWVPAAEAESEDFEQGLNNLIKN